MTNDRSQATNRNQSVLALRSDVQAVAEATTSNSQIEMARQALAYHDPPLRSEILGDLDIAVQLACRRFLTHLQLGDVELARQSAATLDDLDRRTQSSMRLPQAWISADRPPLFERPPVSGMPPTPSQPPMPAQRTRSSEPRIPSRPPAHTQPPTLPPAQRPTDRAGLPPVRADAFIGVQQESMRFLQHHLSPPEVAIAGGSAKCRALDVEIVDAHIQRHGRSGGMNLLEADWAATSHALYYLTPRANSIRRWGWDEVRQIEKVGGGLVTNTIQIDLVSGSPMRWKMAKSAVARVVEVYRQVQ